VLQKSSQAPVVRAYFDGGAKRLAGAFHVGELQLAKPHPLPRAEVARIEPNRLLTIGHGLFVSPHLPVKNRPAVPTFSEVRKFCGGAIQEGERLGKLLPFHRVACGPGETKRFPAGRVKPEVPQGIGGNFTDGP